MQRPRGAGPDLHRALVLPALPPVKRHPGDAARCARGPVGGGTMAGAQRGVCDRLGQRTQLWSATQCQAADAAQQRLLELHSKYRGDREEGWGIGGCACSGLRKEGQGSR